MKKKQGKLIVIDGTDGSGKATQVALLAERLKQEGYTVTLVDFPEYYKNFFGKFIGHCLSEQYYNWVNIHPKIASIAYAADRFESKEQTEKWLSDGYVVIANRYVSANQIHQGGKIRDARKRAAFMKWLDEMEHQVFKIPRPDVVLYLNLPISLVLELMQERNKKLKRKYLGSKKDVHENDKQFLENSRKSALWLAKTMKYFVKIDCAKNNKLRTREDIHNEIYKIVYKKLR